MQAILIGLSPRYRAEVERELLRQRSQVQAEYATLQAALQAAPADLKQVRVLLVQVPGKADLGPLKTLTGIVPGWPVVALVETAQDPAWLLAVMRAGAAQVVPLPLSAGDLGEALQCVLAQHGASARACRVVCLSGVSGGCGASSLALQLACETARQGADRVLLLELARQGGSLAGYLRAEPKITSRDLLDQSDQLSLPKLQEAVHPLSERLSVLFGPYRTLTPTAVRAPQVARLLDYARLLADVLILDLPCTLDDPYFDTLALADTIVLVAEQQLHSIRTLKMVRDLLDREEGLRVQHLVVNRFDPLLPGFQTSHLAQLLQAPQLLTVACDPGGLSLGRGSVQALERGTPLSPALRDLRQLAKVLGLIAESAQGPAGPKHGSGAAHSAASAAPGTARPIRVLHVEDDSMQRDIVQLLLKSLPEYRFEVRAVGTETAALECFRQAEFDLVLQDYQLEQGDGLSCLKQLRALNRWTPIVAISGISTPAIAADLLDAGADDFLSKDSLTQLAFAQAIRTALQRSEAVRRRTSESQASWAMRVEDFFEKFQQAMAAGDLTALFRCLEDFREPAREANLTTGQILRLVDMASASLQGGTGGDQRTLLRPVFLSLFLRLFQGNVAAAETFPGPQPARMLTAGAESGQ